MSICDRLAWGNHRTRSRQVSALRPRIDRSTLGLAVVLGRRGAPLASSTISRRSGLSTLDIRAARRMRARGSMVKPSTTMAPVTTTLAAVCAKLCARPLIDFLKIDVEWHGGRRDRRVLTGRHTRRRIVVVEATRPLDGAPSHVRWEPSLVAGGYLFRGSAMAETVLAAARGRTACAAFQCAPNASDGFQIAEVRPVAGREADRLRAEGRPAAPQHGDATNSTICA